MVVCKRVLYSGRVQGVRFRYTVDNLAEGYQIAGYVRNLPHGDVEVVAEGEAEQVESFLEAIGRRMADCIARSVVQDEVCGGHRDFRIRY